MSNGQVGLVYQKIIEAVLEDCRAPFEEEGAQASVLDDLKKTWQAKISLKKVAEMPWDPKPVAPPPAAHAQQAPQPRQAPQHYQAAPLQGPVNGDGPKIKLEPNDLANLPSAPAYTVHDPNIAIQNAQQNLKAQYGDAANGSIQQLDQRIAPPPHGVKRPLPQASPTSEQFDVKRRVTDYNLGQQQQAQQQMAQLRAAQRQPPAPVGGQTDGAAADWKQMVAERRALAAEGSAAADMSIAERVAALQRAEEGNGLMQPHSSQMKRPAVKFARAAGSGAPPGFDGPDDDDEAEVKPPVDDADAINSDLDDDEEENLEDDDDERPGEIMVCTYEKVARVKNKWKCTLKDGILITGGKEYVFGKASGEFEW